ncbi:hypothetical protein SADUNF_Sadunf10G0033500 [Salix dunnii]|uniref:Large ribosomal subunit protein uL30-like ferredoxin-like fold domain-containing protein n=1 Tax=Salix dunnii TaxID=1413687 RepID=A0A835JPI2_9ROSI|nr:hypothetical protein SADUNF_Sadunf10G0033500 [Salix dunnii]
MNKLNVVMKEVLRDQASPNNTKRIYFNEPKSYIALVRGIPGTRRLHRHILEASRLGKCNHTFVRWNTPTVSFLGLSSGAADYRTLLCAAYQGTSISNAAMSFTIFEAL